MAKAAAPTLASMKILVKCPAKDCKAGIDSGILALFLPPGGALESTFRCVACGEDRPERDKVSLHNPERPTFRPQMSYPRYRVGTRSMLRFGEDDSDDTSPTVVELERLSPVSMPSDLSAAPPAKRARVDPNVEHERTVVASTTGILRSPDGSDEERRHLAKTVGQERRAAGTMRSSEENAVPVACEMCAPCAKRWLAVQSRDGVACVRCPTPQCRATLSRETLELLLTPDGYKEHLDRTKKSFELRLQELRRSARSTSIATANAATAEAARSLAPRSSLAHATTSHGNKAEGDDDGTLAFLKWAGDATRACPECHVIIYRSEGCAHMSCACGAEFNWDRAERILHDAPSSSPAAAAAAIQQRSPATVPFEDVWRPDFGDLDVLLRNNTNNPNSGSGNPDRAIPDDPAELRRALIAEQARTAALRDEIARTSRNAIRRYELARREATRRQSLRDSSSPS